MERVSKHGHKHRVCCPSFETHTFGMLLRVWPEMNAAKTRWGGNAHLACCPSFETRPCGALLRMR